VSDESPDRVVRALVLAGGTEPYVDPWHPFAATAAALGRIAEGLGFEVEVATSAAERVADLSDVDLLIAGVPSPNIELEADVLERARVGLSEFLSRPVGVFALHVSVTTLLGLPQWSELMGARWVQGQTMHPPLGNWPVTVVDGNPLGSEPGEFRLLDELYSYLAFDGPHESVIAHSLEDADHDVLWLREVGRVRVVADALGHGAESFDSPEHVAVISTALRWAADVAHSVHGVAAAGH
jgi:uncharacterized protein